MVAESDLVQMSGLNKIRTDRLSNALRMKNEDLSRSQSVRYRPHATVPIDRPSPNAQIDASIDQKFRQRARTLPNKDRPYPKSPVSREPSTAKINESDTIDSLIVERMRTFTLDPEHATVINRGDSFRCRSNTNRSLHGSSRNSSNLSSRSHSPATQAMPSPMIDMAMPNLDEGIRKYHIIVLGSNGVGKTSMINQFMTSEYCNPFQLESGECPEENTVNVLLDGEESQMTFIEVNIEKSDMWLSLSGAGYIVVYSVDDSSAFRNAKQALYELRERTHTSNKPIILVANKIDLARKRLVSVDDGKQGAKEYNCKFVEITVALGHHVDELLVGVLAQVQFNETDDHLASNGTGSRSELIAAFDAASPTIIQSNRRSSSGSSTASNGKSKKAYKNHTKHHNSMKKWGSLKKLDDAVSTGCTQISSIGERFVQKIFGRRRRQSLEDLLAFQRS